MMGKLTGATLTHFALLTAPLLRLLRDRDDTMTYQELARCIGLIEPGGKWSARHRTQISKVLYTLAAIERETDLRELTDGDFGRIVTAETGKAGVGHKRTARISKAQA